MDTQDLPEWLHQFDGASENLIHHRAAVLATVDAEGWPHLAYLSAGEVLARGNGISLALWPKSRTTANILREGRAILQAAAQGIVWEARLSLKQRASDGTTGPLLFDGVIVETRRHEAPYASVEAMVKFDLHDEAATQKRWAVQLARLAGA